MNHSQTNWDKLIGGYRDFYNPMKALQKLEKNIHDQDAWDELWNELHHQGDVDTASYASVPMIVGIYKSSQVYNWNPFALVTTIEYCRGRGSNPSLANELEDDYFNAIKELSVIAQAQVDQTTEPFEFAVLSSIIARAKGFKGWADILANYSDDEIEDLLSERI